MHLDNTILEVLNRFRPLFHCVLFTFKGNGSCKVRVRLILGFFSEANVLKHWPELNPKVRVRLKLGCGLN